MPKGNHRGDTKPLEKKGVERSENKVRKGRGVPKIAGSDFPVSVAHNEKNGEFILLHRRKRVADMYLKGWSQWEMAHEIGVDHAVVLNDLKVIRETWLEKVLEGYDNIKAQELARIDLIESECWRAWYRSCEEEIVRTRSVEKENRVETEGDGEDKKIVGVKMVPTKIVNKKVSRKLIGDPRFIDHVQWCSEMRCKIFGLVKEKPTNINFINWDQIAGIVAEDTGSEDIEAQIKQLESGSGIQQVQGTRDDPPD